MDRLVLRKGIGRKTFAAAAATVRYFLIGWMWCGSQDANLPAVAVVVAVAVAAAVWLLGRLFVLVCWSVCCDRRLWAFLSCPVLSRM